ncbi:MAG: ComEC/Rec2 family competence protein [Campylobacterota bacterium]
MIERVSLFSSRRDFFIFFFITAFIVTYSLLIEYNNYKNLTRFDSALVNATILKQYSKTKTTKKGKIKEYQVLKLKSDKGFSFYSTAKKSFPYSVGKKVELEVWAGKISFYEYMSSFYAFSKVLHIDTAISSKVKLNSLISSQHEDRDISNTYQALFTAKPLNSEIQTKFSALGISHLVAISGFHLGVLSALLFFLFKYPYKFFQDRYFPYRSYKRDSFIIISFALLSYLLFLDSPPSLLRAFTMLVIGFLLYDRGIKIISMVTLLLTVVFIISFFPRLFLSIGFWLSVSGVFYIFLFLIHFKELSKVWQFILVPFWVYFLMLPYSIVIFGNFSLYHPLSILWTSLFTLFYPLSIFLHLITQGDALDKLLYLLINLDTAHVNITLAWKWLIAFIVLSLLSIGSKKATFLTLLSALSTFVYSIDYMT